MGYGYDYGDDGVYSRCERICRGCQEGGLDLALSEQGLQGFRVEAVHLFAVYDLVALFPLSDCYGQSDAVLNVHRNGIVLPYSGGLSTVDEVKTLALNVGGLLAPER